MYDPQWCRQGEAFETEFARPNGLSIKACSIGENAVANLARFARTHCGSRGFLISDEHTRPLCGEAVARALTDQGLFIREKCFVLPLDATDTLGEAVRAEADPADFIVAVGSGTLSDLAKYAGDKLGIPVLLYATAASMNGYTSGVVALKVRGLKRTLPCVPAAGVFVNPEHAATAPQRMTAAGVADFLSKCSSTTDWRASNLLLDVPFDPSVRRFAEGVQEQLLDQTSCIGAAEPDGVGLVLEALMLSGFAMVAAGSSAPASGGEHLISHYIDMKSALYDLPHDLHGTQVGVATVYCLELWERIVRLEASGIDATALDQQRPPENQIQTWIEEDWGSVASEVQAQWDEKSMSPERFRRYIETFKHTIADARDSLRTDLLPAEIVRRAIAESGGPVDPEDLDVPLGEYRNAQQRGRYIRNRFTVLDLAQDLGLV